MSYHQFSNVYGETYGSFQVVERDRYDCEDAGLIEQDPTSPGTWYALEFGMGGTVRVATDPKYWEGFYWQACWSGCIPDGEPCGPFPTEQAAIDDANATA